MKNVTVIIILIIIVGGGFLLLNNSNQATPIEEEITENIGEVEENQMSFFVTSVNPGTGANYGGLAGADQYCQTLASAVDAGDQTWRAYLSADATEDEEAVNARDRIGSGPWYNQAGVLIAENLEALHDNPNINKETGLSEKGEQINGRGDTPNLHDILTGSNPDGTLAVGEGDTTCSNWTLESADGSAVVGHHDRVGLDDSASSKSWNSSHASRGCSLENLGSTGGGGLLYCFATGQ